MTIKTLHQSHMILCYYSMYVLTTSLLIQLEEFRQEKQWLWNYFGTLFKNSSTVHFSDSIPTRQVDKLQKSATLIHFTAIYFSFVYFLVRNFDKKHKLVDLLKISAHKISRLRLVWMLSQFRIIQFKNSELKNKYIAVL